jgi:hypothetical protein
MKFSPAFALKNIHHYAIRIDVYAGEIVIANDPAGI